MYLHAWDCDVAQPFVLCLRYVDPRLEAMLLAARLIKSRIPHRFCLVVGVIGFARCGMLGLPSTNGLVAAVIEYYIKQLSFGSNLIAAMYYLPVH